MERATSVAAFVVFAALFFAPVGVHAEAVAGVDDGSGAQKKQADADASTPGFSELSALQSQPSLGASQNNRKKKEESQTANVEPAQGASTEAQDKADAARKERHEDQQPDPPEVEPEPESPGIKITPEMQDHCVQIYEAGTGRCT